MKRLFEKRLIERMAIDPPQHIMNKFTYKSVEISLNALGNFTAVVGGKSVVKPSLNAMKNCIDKAGRQKFTPFKAFNALDYRGDKITRFNVVNVEHTARRRHGSLYKFVTDQGKDPVNDPYKPTSVYPDTAENVKAFMRLQAWKRGTERINLERYITEMKLRAKVRCIKADEHFASLSKK